MSKLKLNKKVVSVLDKNQMGSVNGGGADGQGRFLSIHSCSKRRLKRCCNGSSGTWGNA